MILPFSTQLNGKPTYFVERIHKGIRANYMLAPVDPSVHYPPNYNFVAKDKLPQKIHTIREDKKNRWKVGTNIDFFINCRQKDMFRFAPVVPVVSIQEVEIKYFLSGKKKQITIFIDQKKYVCIDYTFGVNVTDFDKQKIMLEFAKNDGFDSVEEFFKYFNEDFKGKIIHWTDFKY